MGNDTSDAQKDESEQEDSLQKLSNDENLSGKDGLLKSQNSLSQNDTLISNNGKWLQIVKNGHKGSFFRVNRIVDSKIPRHVVSLDEKYLRRCLELIRISASESAQCSLSVNFAASVKTGISSYHFDSPVIPKENTPDVPRFVFELPLAGGSSSTVISPTVTGYMSTMHMLDEPVLHKFGALEIDPCSTRRRKDDVKGLVSCDVASSPSRCQLKLGEKDTPDSKVLNHLSETMCKRFVSESSTDSTCFSSELSSSSSTPTTISQGTLRFFMNDNGSPHFVFSLDDQKEIFVANLSNAESDSNSGALQFTYLIHMRKGSGNESHLVGKIKVSTVFSVSSSSNSRVMEREFVLFRDPGNWQIHCHDTRKSKGLPKKVVEALKASVSRQRSVSRFSGASSIPDFCSWEPFQDPNYDHEPVNLLENHLPPNLESSAIVVKEQIPEEQQEVLGGWGLKFLKKKSLAQNHDASEFSKPSTCMDVIIPSGIHGGPRKMNEGPSSLIQRWKSGGDCDCGGWDLGCPLTVLKGQPRKDKSEGQRNIFELFTEGSRQGVPGLRILNVHDGLCFVQFEQKISVLQSFSIAIAYIHCQSQRLRPSLSE